MFLISGFYIFAFLAVDLHFTELLSSLGYPKSLSPHAFEAGALIAQTDVTIKSNIRLSTARALTDENVKTFQGWHHCDAPYQQRYVLSDPA